MARTTTAVISFSSIHFRRLLYHSCENCVPYRVIIGFNSPFALLLSPQTSISFRHTAMSATRADDLGDDYLPDGLVADDPDDAVSLESDEDEPELLDAGPITAASAGTHSANTDDAAKAKKRKRREKEKEKRLKVRLSMLRFSLGSLF